MFAIPRTSATWSIDLGSSLQGKLLRGYLLVACVRTWGGCHTATKNQRVEIAVNDAPFERLRLAYIPPPHDDYFYRPPVPEIPRLGEIAACQTIYAWPIVRERLRESGAQSLKIVIGNEVRWDIDYLGFVFEIEPQPEYDFALSFAGEDREYVEQVADLLVQRGVSEVIGPLPPSAPKKLWTLWQSGKWPCGRPIWQWCAMPAG